MKTLLRRMVAATLAFGGCGFVWSQAKAAPADTSAHRVQFVEVAPAVKLEVVDWGGTGRPVILLAGLGMTAHSFDGFAERLAGNFHVYGITRRGLGVSSVPAPDGTNYTATRLGDDVLAVMVALKIEQPILIGHSFGGSELSSVGSRHPESVAGLVYLDAAYDYAFYDPAKGNLQVDAREVMDHMEKLRTIPLDPRDVISQLLEELPRLERNLKEKKAEFDENPPPKDSSKIPSPPPQLAAMMAGQEKFTSVAVPVLAIYAVPNARSAKDDAAARAKKDAEDVAWTAPYIRTLQTDVPTARIVRIEHADHFLFRSSTSQVLDEIQAFVRQLPR